MPSKHATRLIAHFQQTDNTPATFITLAQKLQVKPDVLNKAIGELLESEQLKRVGCDNCVGVQLKESEG